MLNQGLNQICVLLEALLVKGFSKITFSPSVINLPF